jgi:hypothetical protein
MDRERCSSLLQRALSHGETSLHERIAETAESHARRSRDGFVFGSPPAVRVNCLFMPAEHAGQEKAPNAARTGPGALALIFAYYRCAPLPAALPCPGGVTPCCVRTRSRGSKLQCPGQQVARAPLSFDEIMLANERISFFELLLFFRDFDIVPTLMSKQELTCVWKKCLILNHHNAVVGIDHVVEHSFGLAEFLQLVACIALVAFGARSHAKPAPEAAIDALVEYLRLDSPLHARKIIQTRGRETQARTDEIRARATLLHPHTAPPLVSGASDVSTFDPAASATS